MSKKEKMDRQKQIERKNEEIINDMIDYISLHINSRMEDEYLKSVKEMRSLKEKINNKKLKLSQNGMLEEAYQEKDGRIKENFAEIAREYKRKSKSSYEEIIPEDLVYQMDQYKRRLTKEQYVFVLERTLLQLKEKQKRKKRLAYDTTISRAMEEVLEYYKSELNFWDKYLLKIEKLKNIREFE